MKPLRRFAHVMMATLLLFSLPVFGQDTDSPSKIILTNSNVIDCSGAAPKKNMTVVITGNTISEIRPGRYDKSLADTDVQVFDLANGYVLPGLWNMHMHLSALLPDPNHIQDNESVASA
ncbi:MAG: hypothetical protein ACE5IW_10135, partial [bacterium]